MNDSYPSRPTAFLCYSHEDKAYCAELLPYFKHKMDTVDLDLWHDGRLGSSEEWYPIIKRQLRRAQIVLVLVSPNLLESEFVKSEEIPFIIAKYEAGGMKIFPIVLWGWNVVAERDDWLATRAPAHDHGLTYCDARCNKRDKKKFISQILDRIDVGLDDLRNRPRRLKILANQSPPGVIIQVESLPDSGGDCFGRRDKLKFLHKAWEQQQINVIGLIAAGGYGKSTLVDRFLIELGEKDWGDATRVFGWSFCRQSGSGYSFSAQPFIEEALKWFGDPYPTSGSTWDQGQRLAKRISSQRTILILDGLEPLQWSFGKLRSIKDPALAVLIEALAEKNQGLCIITSRQRVDELDNSNFSKVAQIDLEPLKETDGVQLLQAHMVTGTEDELKALSRSVRNHALALTLLHSWLTRKSIPLRKTHTQFYQTDLSAIADMADESNPASPVLRLIEFSLGTDSAELQLLRIVSLSDRPITITEINNLISIDGYDGKNVIAPIEGISTAFVKNPTEILTIALGELHELRLISYSEAYAQPLVIDAHPLVKEHFLRSTYYKYKSGYAEAHRRLAAWFDQTSQKKPKDIKEAEPLYLAAHHLGLSGDLFKASKYYWDNIRQGDTLYNLQELSAYGYDLSVLYHFFEKHWTQISPDVPTELHAKILRDVAICWQTHCHLPFATDAMLASLSFAKQNDPAEASYSASYLSELLIIKGEIEDAEMYGLESVELGQESGDEFAFVSSFSSAADALHQAGKINEAHRYFNKGIEYQRKYQEDPKWRSIFTLQGYHYSCFLLTIGEFDNAISWTKEQINSGRSEKISQLTYALDHIALGNALLRHGGKRNIEKAHKIINQGVILVRESRDNSLWPAALLARAHLARVEQRYDEAMIDLNDVKKISSQGSGMPLYCIDAEIERIRIMILNSDYYANENEITCALHKMEELVKTFKYFKKTKDLKDLSNLRR